MHKLLARQLRKFFGSPEAVPDSIRPFVDAVEDAYRQSDEDRAMVEHSMETVSIELADRLARLRGALDERDELTHALSLLEATLESTADGILVTDLDGAVVRSNSKFQELWKVPPAMIEARDGNAIMEFLAAQLEEPGDFPTQARERWPQPEPDRIQLVRCVDGRTFGWFSKSQRVVDAVVGRVWSFRDVSARLALEAQLRQAQKMDAVGQLAGGVAHDFNNLLTIIRVNAELIESGGESTGDQRDSVIEISRAAERASELTRQLLAFSRKQILKARVFDLDETVAGLKPMLRRLIGEDVDIVTQCGDEPARVFADPGQLEQVVVNLAINARDAMPGGGRLIIETSIVELTGDRSVTPGGSAPAGEYVLLKVTDTGIGIPAESLGRIFEPFYTTKERGKGTGLGLSVLYGIVKQSDGYIWVESKVGSGTSFSIYLPRATGEVVVRRVSGEAPRATGEMAAVRSETVLVAEDEGALARLIEGLLRTEGYRVLVAHNGVEATKVAAAHAGPIDLLVTDVIMPGMGGRDLADRLRVERPGIRTLFISGYTNNEIDRGGVLPSDAYFLQKPFSRRALSRAVRLALHEKQEVRSTK